MWAFSKIGLATNHILAANLLPENGLTSTSIFLFLGKSSV